MTEREKFMARLAEAREAGLVDQKFFFHPARAFKPEEIFAAMNQVEDAVKRGIRHTEWIGNGRAVAKAA
jgi:aminoglycoside phosphotransferase